MPSGFRGIYFAPSLPGLTCSSSRASQIANSESSFRVRETIKTFKIFFRVALKNLIPEVIFRFRVKQNYVVNWPKSFCAVVGTCAFPDDFTPEIIFSHDRIAQQLEVMGGGGVAVEVERAGGFEDAAQFDEARGHHREVGH